MPNDGEAIVKVNGFDFYSFKLVKEDNEFFILTQGPSLEGVLSVYRNLRENYEYRLRYNESGQFFIKEMEYKEPSKTVMQVKPSGKTGLNATCRQ
jgi:hypothetical protein